MAHDSDERHAARDAAARERRRRTRPFRLVLAVQVADVVVGVFVYLLAGRFPVAGEVFRIPVMEFVGLALIVIGVVGFVLFKALERAAARRPQR